VEWVEDVVAWVATEVALVEWVEWVEDVVAGAVEVDVVEWEAWAVGVDMVGVEAGAVGVVDTVVGVDTGITADTVGTRTLIRPITTTSMEIPGTTIRSTPRPP